MPSLFVFRGNDQGNRFELEADPIPIGRDATNVVRLHDHEVSRRHAELRRRGRTYDLKDLGSSNGTYVNGKRVEERVLVSGDHVQVGSTLMLYTCAEEESSSDLAAKIDIIARQHPDDGSRIVSSISQEEGSRLLESEEVDSQSPWLARIRSNLQVMYRTALAVSHTLDIDQLLARIMQLIFEWVEADRGCIMLVHPDTRQLEPRVRHRRGKAADEERITISKTILDYVLEHNEGVLTSDARQDARWEKTASILQTGVREAICVPMRGRYDVVGIIYIDTTTEAHRVLRQGSAAKFSQEHLKLLIAIAHQAALAIEDTRYYSAMVQAERLAAVGQTIATLSHHIKNILQGIRGGSYLIKEGLSQHDETMVRRGWEFVERNQDRISNLVLDMLTFSKDRQPELVPSDLNQIVGEVVELMQPRAAEKATVLAWSPGNGIPSAVFDPEGLHRAVLNVVTNAIDACENCENGRVEVRTLYDPAGETLRIAVKDNGCGIADEDRESIFSLFVSGKGNRGTGLGLPVSQKILKEHGGRIAVESQVGQGSMFTLELPAVAPEADQRGIKDTSANP